MRSWLSPLSFLPLLITLLSCGDNSTALRTIADHVKAESSLSEFEAGLDDAELLDTLDGPGPYTLFAFRDGSYDLDALDLADRSQLLAYHIHEGQKGADELERTTALSTLEGGEIHVRFGLDGLLLNDGVVVSGESITAENGIIHFVDRALVRTTITRTLEFESTPNLPMEGFTGDSITIEDTGYIHDIQVSVDIQDKDVSNLSVYLIKTGEDGEFLTLLSGARSSLDDVKLRFADGAANDIVADLVRDGDAGDKAFPNEAYRPWEPLEFGLGQILEGEWELLIFNFGEEQEEGAITSNLLSWKLRVTVWDDPPAPALVFGSRDGVPAALGRRFTEVASAEVERVGGLSGAIELQGNAGEINATPGVIEEDFRRSDLLFPIPAAAELGARKVSLSARIGTVSRIISYDSEVAEPQASGIELLSQIPLPTLGASAGTGTDIWGWTDPSTGAEIAVMGTSDGTAFVDVSAPSAPLVLGILPTESGYSTWRDMKVFQDHAFIVSEAEDHGMQIFDMTQLRGITETQTLTATATNTSFGNAHNIAINEDTATAYVVGSNYDGCDGGMLVFDISTPLAPVAISCFSGGVTNGQAGGPLYPTDVYTHDVQCVTYAGPDTDYQGSDICFSSDTQSIGIADFSDRSNPAQIVRITYASAGYTHQGWLTEDHKYFIMNDEFDEVDLDIATRSYIFDVSDLDAPVQVGAIDNPTPAIGHNTYITGDIAYQANYTSGLRLVDLNDIAAGNTPEIAFYDTHPDDDKVCRSDTDCGIATYDGAWSTYPFFASGVIVVSDIQRGLFVLKPGN